MSSLQRSRANQTPQQDLAPAPAPTLGPPQSNQEAQEALRAAGPGGVATTDGGHAAEGPPAGDPPAGPGGMRGLLARFGPLLGIDLSDVELASGDAADLELFEPPSLERLWRLGWSVAAGRTAPSTGSDDPALGTVLPGRFRLDARLAEGGFGIVYRARQLAIGRDVAVKVMRAGIDPFSEDGRLFVQEIQAVGRIDHANVVRVYQADVTADGRLFFAMELLDGRDLQAQVEAGPTPLADAVALVAPLPFAALEPEIVWSPFDLSPEGQRRLHARFAAHERWRRAAL